jgi:hypothetical protein
MRMRADEIRALADEMHDDQPKAIMRRIAAEYEKLVEWAEKGSDPLFAQQVRQVRHVSRDSTCLVLGKQLPLAAERGEPNFTGRRKFGTMT